MNMLLLKISDSAVGLRIQSSNTITELHAGSKEITSWVQRGNCLIHQNKVKEFLSLKTIANPGLSKLFHNMCHIWIANACRFDFPVFRSIKRHRSVCFSLFRTAVEFRRFALFLCHKRCFRHFIFSVALYLFFVIYISFWRILRNI